MACPCGFTQEQLLAAPDQLLGLGGVCIAFRKDKSLNPDGSRAQCGELAIDHPLAPPVPIVQQHPVYHAIFSWKKSKSPLCNFSNYDTMLEMIHRKWPDLKHKHLLVVKHKDFLLEVVDDESLNNLFETLGPIANVELLVDTKCIGFRDYASKPEAVLELLNCRINENAKFDLDMTISDEFYENETIVVREELLRRVKLLDLEQASEYTMRELISPVLFGALSLVGDDPSERVKLICEKIISGNSGQGPVDYILSYKSVYIVIGEAKKSELKEGFNQNVMQQWNYLESLADKSLPFRVSGRKRKVDFEKVFNKLKKLGTFGITSTGEKWIFSRVEEAPEGSEHSVIVRQSDIYAMSLLHQEINCAAIDQQVKTLLRIIVHMIKYQKEILFSNFSHLLSPDTQSNLKVADESEMKRYVQTKGNDDDVDDDEDAS